MPRVMTAGLVALHLAKTAILVVAIVSTGPYSSRLGMARLVSLVRLHEGWYAHLAIQADHQTGHDCTAFTPSRWNEELSS